MEEVHEFETLFHCTEMKYNEEVAPLAGAWIETRRCWSGEPIQKLKSHPSRVRGLKLEICARLLLYLASHPSRVRGLKLNVRSYQH